MKNTAVKIIIIFLLFGTILPCHAQLETISNKILNDSALISLEKNSYYPSLDSQQRQLYLGHIDMLKKIVQFFETYNSVNLKWSGDASFGFVGKESNLNNRYNINSGIKLSRGVYPFEFEYRTKIETVIEDGDFQENVSDLFISLDFHPGILEKKDRLIFETFGFLNRYSNNYLGIEERYEIGFGFLLNGYIGKILEQEVGKKKMKDSYNILREFKKSDMDTSNRWLGTYQEYARSFALSFRGKGFKKFDR